MIQHALLHKLVLSCAVCSIISGFWMSSASAQLQQQPVIHYFQNANLPPGAIGAAQASRGGPVYGYLQPVRIMAPTGTLISIAEDGNFSEASTTSSRMPVAAT